MARDIGVLHNPSVVPGEVAEVVGDDERQHCGRGGVESGHGVRIRGSRFDALLLLLVLWMHHLISILSLLRLDLPFPFSILPSPQILCYLYFVMEILLYVIGKVER
ncbi:unnamed protein product [Sphenostylis stenocarpa]|uniref:Uncharacterized protein n=1 Tax=Sphenostylis stenocarpa TaxID=92480 RepID=A0AA86W3K7_9FABA|nr:unnamed protein product [Sphenostylis stenocarpa]